MHSRYTAPAASAGGPARPSGIICSIAASRPGLTPTLMSRPCTVIVAPPSAGAWVSLVWISPNATVLTVTL